MGGDHRAADRRVVVGRLWVKGAVAGVGGFLVGAEVHTAVSFGVGSRVFDVFSMCWQGSDLVFGSWTGDLGSSLIRRRSAPGL